LHKKGNCTSKFALFCDSGALTLQRYFLYHDKVSTY
jgi:hypothetical protein